MFDSITLNFFQNYWWLIISLLGGLFAFMSFVQGGQTLLYTLGKNDDERNLIINSLGRKWELTFTTLVMFGGAIFAAFPLFYATSFGGAYYVWMAILFSFIIQAVSYEYRKKPNNVYGDRFYEKLLYINGSVGVFLIGVALGTLYTGGNFEVNEMNLSHWTQSSYGLEALFNPFNISFGFMLIFLSRIGASLYFFNNLKNDNIERRVINTLRNNNRLFLPLFLYVIGYALFKDTYVYNASTLVVSIESMKLFHNLINHSILLLIFIVGILLFLYSIFIAIVKKSKKAIWFYGIGIILIVTTFLFILGIDNTIYYPSLSDMQSSLSIENSSGSYYTLFIMSIVSILIPVVLTYIYFVWRSIDNKKMTIEEIKADPHHY